MRKPVGFIFLFVSAIVDLGMLAASNYVSLRGKATCDALMLVSLAAMVIVGVLAAVRSPRYRLPK